MLQNKAVCFVSKELFMAYWLCIWFRQHCYGSP